MKKKVANRTMVFEEADVFTAQEYLRNLATGRSPLDGEDLAEDHLLRDPALVGAMNLAADLLEAWMDNGGFNRVEPDRTRPFEISDTDRGKIVISDEAVGIMTIANRISKVLPYDMKTVRYGQISAWLQYIGALEWKEEEGKKRRVSTAVGEQLGIRNVSRRAADGTTYRKNVYDANAQRFILDNLEGIMSYSSQAKVREAAEKVEASQGKAEAPKKAETKESAPQKPTEAEPESADTPKADPASPTEA